MYMYNTTFKAEHILTTSDLWRI